MPDQPLCAGCYPNSRGVHHGAKEKGLYQTRAKGACAWGWLSLPVPRAGKVEGALSMAMAA